ncbi:hypothetical protein ACD661_05720 [Legionella lytica]|uniref:Uncharacterized protein n=1 Tax=Legionella lytica TaxID=96232 RepID=A0ABW8D5S2_9GAMM
MAIIAHSAEERDVALDILGEWGMCWMQEIESSENIDKYKSLIDSLSITNLQKFYPNSSVNATLCALHEQWDTRLKAYLEKGKILTIQPL